MQNFFFLLCLCGLLSFALPAQSQDTPEREVEHTTGFWLGSYTKYRLGKRLFYYGEYHFRRRDNFIKNMGQIYLRFGMTYLVNKKFEITGGVVTPMYWAPPYLQGKEGVETWVPQYRFWEQFLFVQPVGRFKLYHTFRLEQRWRKGYYEGDPFRLTFRFRYKFTAYCPLNHEKLVNRTLFFSGYNEIFMQAGKPITYNHFEDNRFFVGLGYIINENFQVQTGYMWTYRHAGGPYSYEHRHIPRLSFYHNLDFYRRKIERNKRRPVRLNNEF